MKISKIVIGLLLIFLVVVTTFAAVRIFLPNTFGLMPYRHWMMGNGNYYQEDIDYKTEAEIQNDIDDSNISVQIDTENNSISYEENEITIVIVGGPEEADEKFVIYDLVNPTLYIPQDASVTIEFANADQGMPHDFVITDATPPYSYMSMMFSGSIYPDSTIDLLPEASEEIYPVAKTTFKASQKGEYYYICLYPGHAAEGMYGKVIIE